MENKKHEIVSLFAGCGGLDLGFKKAGFKIKWANEYDSTIWETYERNHPETVLTKKSIKKIPSSNIPECDGVIGGPPCQSWSLAGSMGGIDDNRGKLFYEYARIIRDKEPLFFLTENVPGIISKSHVEEFKNILKLFRDIGYVTAYKKLNAAHYGVPQTRKRVFVVGFREDLGLRFDFPAPTHVISDNGEGALMSDVKPMRTLEDAIGGLPEPPPAKDKNHTNGDELEINAHEYYVGNFSSRYMSRNRRRGWEEPAYTVQASGRHARLHPSSTRMVKVRKDNWKFENDSDDYRRLSVRESARIQTFPDDFEFIYEKVNDGYKMVGNAVPVELARTVAASIREQLGRNAG